MEAKQSPSPLKAAVSQALASSLLPTTIDLIYQYSSSTAVGYGSSSPVHTAPLLVR